MSSSTAPSSDTDQRQDTDQTQDTAVKSAVKECCLLCGLIQGSEECFDEHISSSEGSGRVMYKCKVCKYKKRYKSQLRKHLRAHTGEKRHACPHCPHRTITRTEIAIHIRSKHKGWWSTLLEFSSSHKILNDFYSVLFGEK